MTQAELAEKIGVTRQTLLAIEAAKYSPSLELAFRIAKVFGVPLDQVDFSGLASRLRQNSVQEKLTTRWISHCLKETSQPELEASVEPVIK